MFKGLFFAILVITLVVNLIFLFATKDKPPDSGPSTLQTHYVENLEPELLPTAAQRRLFLRSNDESYDSLDYSPKAKVDVVDRLFLSNNQLDKKLTSSQDNYKVDEYPSDIPNSTPKSNESYGIENSTDQDVQRLRKHYHPASAPKIEILSVNEYMPESNEPTRLKNNNKDSNYKTNDINGHRGPAKENSYHHLKNQLANRDLKFSNSFMKNSTPHMRTLSRSNMLKQPQNHQNQDSEVQEQQDEELRDDSMQMKPPIFEEAFKLESLGLTANSTNVVPQLNPSYSPLDNPSLNCSRFNDCKKLDAAIITKQTIINTNVIDSLSDNGLSRKRVLKLKEVFPYRNKKPDRWLDVKVKSSKNRVFISVDNIIIYESKTGDISQGRQSSRIQFRSSPQTNYMISSNHGSKSANLEPDSGRGIHVIILNQYNGNVMSKRQYDTYLRNQDKELGFYLNMIQDGRIIILAVKDEASFGMPFDSQARKLLSKLGSLQINNLQWRDMWACVLRKTRPIETNVGIGNSHRQATNNFDNSEISNIAESLNKSPGFSEWAPPVDLQVRIKLIDDPDSNMTKCQESWRKIDRKLDKSVIEDEIRRRIEFCAKTEGYGLVCDCTFPTPISFNPKKISSTQLDEVPIIVIAGNRPYYLHRMLRSLLSADGVNPDMITIFIDGFYEEPVLVSRLFNLRSIQQTPQARRGARISHHYKTSLTKTFETFPEAKFVIIFEEDLDISQDTLVYFNQTMDLLRNDPSLYCVSAWNDQGYKHTSRDPKLLYRVETMPGLGWMLKRDLYKQELEPRWPGPERPHDWDMWIRMEAIRKGRECIIPDVSRTFHFGSAGTNINSYFQNLYFSKHAFNMEPLLSNGSDWFADLKSLSPIEAYEDHMKSLIRNGTTLILNQNVNVTDQLCSLAKIEPEQDHHRNSQVSNPRIIYIRMIDNRDYKNWLRLASCWKIWDLDARGQHKSTWRLFLGHISTFVIGYPASIYSHLKPLHVIPFDL